MGRVESKLLHVHLWFVCVQKGRARQVRCVQREARRHGTQQTQLQQLL